MRHAIVSACALVVFMALVLALCLTTTASAPSTGTPAPTGHEAYPFHGDPPSGHEQAVFHGTLSTTGQHLLYSKFVGFYQDYAKQAE